jgi:hypothetical protein
MYAGKYLLRLGIAIGLVELCPEPGRTHSHQLATMWQWVHLHLYDTHADIQTASLTKASNVTRDPTATLHVAILRVSRVSLHEDLTLTPACRFREGAVCDPSNAGCCTDQCQFASAGTICRPSVHETCDMAETCTGNNATCPPDRTADDGTSCGANGLACASGRCTSLDLQCQNAGVSMNLTRACGQRDDTSCVVSCRDPRISNQCVVLQTPLVDGSPCGYGGHCYNQTCEQGSWQSTAASWYRQNLNIAIPVTVVVGLIVLAILFFLLRCIFRACTGTRKRRRGPLPPPPQRQSMMQRPMSQAAVPTQGGVRNSDSSTDPMLRQSGYGYPAPPEQAYQHDYGHGGYPNGGYQNGGYSNPYGNGSTANNGWIDERLYNGPHYGRQEAWGR